MRRIGTIVDGQSEYKSLPLVASKISIEGAQFIKTLYAPIQPYAPAGVIARACKSPIAQLAKRRATDIIILIDLENRQDCPGDWAGQILKLLTFPSGCRGSVVIKNRTFENWLIADLDALRASPKRYAVPTAIQRRISPDRADSCDALRVLKDITDSRYEKVADSQIILANADPLKIASNSRSFRRFLRVTGHTDYRTQSARPVAL